MTTEMMERLSNAICRAIEKEFPEAERMGSGYLVNNNEAHGWFASYNIGNYAFDISQNS